MRERSSDPEALVAAGARIGHPGAPALIVRGKRDPCFAPGSGEALAARLPAGNCEITSEAGHRPRVQGARVIDRVATFANT